MTRHWITGRTARLLFGLATFALLVWLFNPREIGAILLHADPGYVAVTLALSCIVLALRGYRWQLVLRDIGMTFPFWKLMEITLISAYFGTFLPGGGIGGDVYRVYDLGQISSKTLRPLATIIIERVTGVLALITVCVVAILLYARMMPFPTWILLSVAGAIVLAALLGLLALGQLDRVTQFIKTRLPPRFASRWPDDKIAVAVEVVRDVRKNKIVFIRAYAIGLVIQVFVLVTYFTASLSLQKEIPLRIFFVFFPLIEFISMIPITINGIGVKEGLLVYFLRYANVTPTFSMSLSIMYRLVYLVFAATGGILWMLRKPSTRG